MSRRDVFLTWDKGLLGWAEELKRRFGIIVMKPVAADGPLKLNPTPVGEDQHRQDGERLSDREHAHQRIALPGLRPCPVLIPTPQINNRLAIHDNGNTLANLFTLGQVLLKRFADGLEGRNHTHRQHVW